MSDTKFVTAADLETRYSRDRSAFARWTRDRGFPAPKYLGNRKAWLLAEIEEWEARGGLSPNAPTTARNLGTAA